MQEPNPYTDALVFLLEDRMRHGDSHSSHRAEELLTAVVAIDHSDDSGPAEIISTDLTNLAAMQIPDGTYTAGTASEE